MAELLPWHEPLWQQWQQRRAAGRTPHAILLSGPDGLGKRRFADYLSQSLMCKQSDPRPCGICQSCQLMSVGNHPDRHILQPEEEGKLIKVDAIRQLIHQAGLTAPAWRVFILQPAEAMNAAAANALLKTLEEPRPETLIMLLSAAPQQLPATIRSRCQMMPFRPVAQTQTLHWLQTQQSEVNWAEIIAYTGNQPLLAIQAQAEGWLDTAYQTLHQLMEMHTDRANPVQTAKAWSERPLSTVLHEIQCACSDLAHHAGANGTGRLFFPAQQAKLQPLSMRIKPQGLFGFVQQLHQAQSELRHNLNPTMLLEKVAITWVGLDTNTSRLA